MYHRDGEDGVNDDHNDIYDNIDVMIFKSGQFNVL